jgi:hypothetical protein
MNCSQPDRIRLQLKRIENGKGLLQNEVMYLEERMKKAQSDYGT